MIGHYQVKSNNFTMTNVVRSNLTVHKVKGRFFPNGDLQSAEGYAYKPRVGKDSILLQSYQLKTKNDSTLIEQKAGNNVKQYRYAGKGMLHLGINPYVFYMPLLATYAPQKVGDSLVSAHYVLDKGVPFTVKRISKTRLTAGSHLAGNFTLSLDEKGQVNTIDAIGSSWNLKGRVIPYLNMDSLIRAEALQEQRFGRLADINKADSVEATIGSTVVKINYSRPSVRGRVIFGEVVPWNRYWRTGANAATKLSISHSIFFNGQELPAGVYSLFTMPTQTGWTLLINKEATIWGTRYNPDKDILRVPMQVAPLKNLVELLTITVVPADGQGVIHIDWERTNASVTFSTKK